MRGGNVFRMNLDGTRRRQLTTAPAGGEDLSPQFSPSGTEIVFERLDNRGRFNALMIMRANGSRVRQLTHPGTLVDWNPAWQPLR